jgi:drug/metabolite transporter (DMT)-like permease
MALNIRGFFLLLINSYIIRANHLNVNQTDKHVYSILLKRSIFNACSITFLLMALPYLPIGITNSLFNIGPLIVFYIESAYYQKSINKVQFGLTFVCFIGVLLIIKPTFIFGGLSSS